MQLEEVEVEGGLKSCVAAAVAAAAAAAAAAALHSSVSILLSQTQSKHAERCVLVCVGGGEEGLQWLVLVYVGGGEQGLQWLDGGGILLQPECTPQSHDTAPERPPPHARAPAAAATRCALQWREVTTTG